MARATSFAPARLSRPWSARATSFAIRFDNIGGGLASRDGKPPNWFEIIGKESDWTKADAVIEGDSVVLSADKVKAPAAMRFAWGKSAAPNLMNKEGLPASAFRSGKEPVIDILGLKVAESKDYELLYVLDLARASRDLVYDVDRRAQMTRPIDRVAYFLELRNTWSADAVGVCFDGRVHDRPGEARRPQACLESQVPDAGRPHERSFQRLAHQHW